LASLIAILFEAFFHAKGLTTIMWVIAMVPIILTMIMMFVTGFAFYTLFTRRDSIKLTLTIKNKDVFEGYGIKMMPSDNYEWIVAEVRVKKAGMVQQKIKIGGSAASKKEGDKIGAPAQQDTSQGLLGNLEGVNFDE
jgi:hypothetical protein